VSRLVESRRGRRAHQRRTEAVGCAQHGRQSVDSGCRAAYLHLPSAAPRQTTGVRPIDEMCSSLLSLRAPETCTIVYGQTQLSQPSLALKVMILALNGDHPTGLHAILLASLYVRCNQPWHSSASAFVSVLSVPLFFPSSLLQPAVSLTHWYRATRTQLLARLSRCNPMCIRAGTWQGTFHASRVGF
jgi:hypothetical protein